jgi:hypothetical protein
MENYHGNRPFFMGVNRLFLILWPILGFLYVGHKIMTVNTFEKESKHVAEAIIKKRINARPP